MGRTHYDVLGITPTATTTLIRAAYRARIREVHPDNGGSESEAALVNEAFGILADEHTRRDYDLTLAVDHAPAAPAPSAPGASFRSEQSSQPYEPEAFRPSGVSTPLWKRGNTARNAVGIAVVWILIAVLMGALATQRADSLGIVQPSVAGFFLATAPLAPLFLIITKARWWWVLLSCFGYTLFCGSQSISGHGAVMLTVTLVAAIAIRVIIARGRRTEALEVVGDFWAACANPELSGWFVARSISDRQTCLVQLLDVVGAGRAETSAMLWGNHPAGTYVIADLTTSPASVLLSVTSAQMKAAKKSRR